jgi:hypothetical protein
MIGVRRLWLQLSTLALAIIFSLLLTEGFCRVMLPPFRHWFPKGMYVADPIVKYRLARNFVGEVRTPYFHYHVRTSSEGCRGPEFRPDPAKNLIVLYGDSFAFGQGVEEQESFAGLLSQDLEPYNYQLLNAGVYGYATAQEYSTNLRFNALYKIKTIVLQVCWNDVLNQAEPVRRGVYRGYLNAKPPTTIWGKIKAELLLHSEFISRLDLVARKAKATKIPEFLAPNYETMKAREIESTEAVLEKWISEANAHEQRFIVLYTPLESEVDAANAIIVRARKQGKEIDPDAAHRWLTRILARHPEVLYADVVAAFRDHYRKGGSSLYIKGDEHTKLEGNKLIARTVEAVLLRNKAQTVQNILVPEEEAPNRAASSDLKLTQ